MELLSHGGEIILTIGIRLENCSNVRIDNVTGVGLDEVISAENTHDLSASNIVAINTQIDFDKIIRDFNSQIKDTPFYNENYSAQAIDTAIEMKKNVKDKTKLEKFKNSLKNLYNYIDKGTKLATTVISIINLLEKIQ